MSSLRVYPEVFEAIQRGQKRIEARLYKPGEHLTPLLVGLQPSTPLTLYTNAAELEQATTADQVQRIVAGIKHFNPMQVEEALAFLAKGIKHIIPPDLQANTQFQKHFNVHPHAGQNLESSTIDALSKKIRGAASHVCFIQLGRPKKV